MTSKSNIGARLKACNCIADARKVLQEANAGPAVKKLVETAYALRDQDNIKRSFIDSAIQEMDDPKGSKPFVANVGDGEDDVDKKVTESGDIVSGSGTSGSEQSSDTIQPYPKEGTEGQVTGLESASGEDQMKEGMPPPPNGMPQGPMPPIAPQLMQGMQPQLPPGLNPAVLQQMQYTVKEALKPILTHVARQQEAIKALDSRLRETETNKASMTLDIGSVKENAMARNIHETTSFNDGLPKVSFNRMKLEETRNEIYEMNNMLNGAQ